MTAYGRLRLGFRAHRQPEKPTFLDASGNFTFRLRGKSVLPSSSSSPRDSFSPLTIPVLFGQQLANRPLLPLCLLLPRSRHWNRSQLAVGFTALRLARECPPRMRSPRVRQPAGLGTKISLPTDSGWSPPPGDALLRLPVGWPPSLSPPCTAATAVAAVFGLATRSQQALRAPAETIIAAQRFRLSSRYGLR